MTEDYSEQGRRRDMIAKARAGMSEEEFAALFVMSRTTARLFIYKVKKGIIRETVGPRRPRQGRRGRAIAMYAEGKTVDDVIAATGLKRATALSYRWEHDRMKQHYEAQFESRDPLCD